MKHTKIHNNVLYIKVHTLLHSQDDAPMLSMLHNSTGPLSPGTFISSNSPVDRHEATRLGHSPGFHWIQLTDTVREK